MLNAYTPSSARGFIIVNILADALCGAGDECGRLLVPQREIDWQPTVFWALAYSAILATALAWSLWLFVLKNLPASIASLSTLAVPVCGVLFSWWLLGENPGAVEGSGIVLIVLALALVSRKKKEAVSVKSI